MSLGLKGLCVAAAAAAGLGAAAYAAAAPAMVGVEPGAAQPGAAEANPWTTPGSDAGPINGRAAMALREGSESRYTGIDDLSLIGSTSGGVPEPAAWALMIVGFGGVGALLRRRRRTQQAPSGA